MQQQLAAHSDSLRSISLVCEDDLLNSLPPSILQRLASFTQLTHLSIDGYSFAEDTASLLRDVLHGGAGRHLQSIKLAECLTSSVQMLLSIGEWVCSKI